MLDREVEDAVDEFKGMFKTFGYFFCVISFNKSFKSF